MTEKSPAKPIRRVALLRAVNVGGHGVLKMESLRRAFFGLGFTDVRTLLQSGNVVFTSPVDEPEAEMAGRIKACLRDTLAIETTVFLRTRRELEKLVRRDPFGDEAAGWDVKKYVAFLERKPKPGLTDPVLSAKDGLTLFSVEGREAFLLLGRVNGRYGFPNQFIETRLDIAATTRNWNTVVKLAETI
jgi:uncharacterized protein (DUF1697 family)